MAVSMSKLMKAREAMAVPMMHCSVSRLASVSAWSGWVLRSNVLTPFSTALMISSFSFSKAVCRSWVQTKYVLGFSRLLKGSMMSDWEKAKLHWFMGPNNDLIPVMSLGLGKSLMTPRNFSEGLTESPVST